MTSDGHTKFMKVVLMEILLTMTLVVIYLAVKYLPSLQKVDKILKMMGVIHVFMYCLQIRYYTRAIMNPALAMTITTY